MEEDSKKHNGFKIFDDEAPAADAEEADILLDNRMAASDPGPSSEGASPEGKKPRRTGKLRTFFIVILIICMAGAIGVGMYAVYERINERLNHIETTGAHEMAGLLKEIDERLSLLASQFAAQHAEMQLQIEKAAKQAEENSTSIHGLQSTINTQRQALSGDISALDTRLVELDRQIHMVEAITAEEMKTIEERVDALAAAVAKTEEIASAVEAVEDDMNRFRAKIESFSPDEITREMRDGIEKEITEAKQEFNRRIEAVNNRFDQQLVSLKNEMSALEAMMRSLRNLTLQKDNGLPEIIEEDLGELP